MATATQNCKGCGAQVSFTESERKASDVKCPGCGRIVVYQQNEDAQNESTTLLD